MKGDERESRVDRYRDGVGGWMGVIAMATLQDEGPNTQSCNDHCVELRQVTMI